MTNVLSGHFLGRLRFVIELHLCLQVLGEHHLLLLD